MSKSRRRSRKTAKVNGSRWESAMESYLQWALDDLRIVRPRLKGAKDVGDIVNIYYRGSRSRSNANGLTS